MHKKILILLFATLMVLPNVFANGQKEKGPRTVTIDVWTREGDTNHWRADLALEAAEDLNKELLAEGSDITVVAKPYIDGGDWGGFKKKYALAADSGKAPLIIISGHEDIATWGAAGYIEPLASSISEVKSFSPEFADIKESLWSSAAWQGKIWGVPQDTEARPMYFNKTLLKELGWSDQEIADLPAKMADGSFTLYDLLDTASEAVEKGVVEPGYGFWHRPKKGGDFLQVYVAFGGQYYDKDSDKLVIDKDALVKAYQFQRDCVEKGITPASYIGTEWNIWHDVVSNNKALFFNGGTWMWADWAKNYVEGGEKTLFKNIGYGYEPSGIAGVKGTTLSHPLVYLISSESASGVKDQELAERLISLMSTTERNTRHAVESGHLGILNSQDTYAPYLNSEFLSSTGYLLDNNIFQPNHPMYGIWFDSFWDNLVSAEQGEKTPEQAATDAIKVMKLELEDQIIIK